MKLIASILTLLLLTPAATAEENRFAKVEIETIKITDRIYMLVGAGGNIGVSRGDDGILMIDDQFAPLSNKIKKALASLGEDTPRFLLNTHYHGDHTGGNEAFGPDSLIVAHDNVRIRLLAEDQNEEISRDALPVVTYQAQANIYFNHEKIRLVHMPRGHTDGDTIVSFEESNVVHMGDHFFKDRFPYVDLEAGGTVQGMIENVTQALEVIGDDTVIIPGHGSLAVKSDLQRFLAMLEQTRDSVRAAMAEGRSMEEIVEMGLDSRWDSWGSGFINEERWIQTLYNSYSGTG